MREAWGWAWRTGAAWHVILALQDWYPVGLWVTWYDSAVSPWPFLFLDFIYDTLRFFNSMTFPREKFRPQISRTALRSWDRLSLNLLSVNVLEWFYHLSTPRPSAHLVSCSGTWRILNWDLVWGHMQLKRGSLLAPSPWRWLLFGLALDSSLKKIVERLFLTWAALLRLSYWQRREGSVYECYRFKGERGNHSK